MTLPVPPVIWAQRANLIYLTICLEDCKDPDIKLDNEKLYFKGVGGSSMKEHETTLKFFDKIKADESKFIVRDRGTEFVLYKEEDKWWSRLLEENKKFHWLKVDFNKWKDEEDVTDEDADFNPTGYEAMMRELGASTGGDFTTDFNDGIEEGEGEGEGEGEDEELPELE